MNRYKEGTQIPGVEYNLPYNSILRLETILINQGNLLETNKLVYDQDNNLIILYEHETNNLILEEIPSLNLMDISHSNIPSSSSNPTPIYSTTNQSVGQPRRPSCNEYKEERDYERPRGKSITFRDHR